MPTNSEPSGATRNALTMEQTSSERTLHILKEGQVEVIGQFTWSSNFTFLTKVIEGEVVLQAVYKPSKGERPLWDFPRGSLAAREVAAYLTSETLGWNFVPPTVMRGDGPAGPGSLQLYIDTDYERHYFTFDEGEKDRLRPVAAFDLLINNADRKGGHILLTDEGKIWLIDHGVCFHTQDKMRTVVWDFVGEAIPEALLGDVRTFSRRLRDDTSLQESFSELLEPSEVDALRRRAERILADPIFPEPGPGRPYPWPLV
jgi:uncharacterized repeat protein (TIGR03843 family)